MQLQQVHTVPVSRTNNEVVEGKKKSDQKGKELMRHGKAKEGDYRVKNTNMSEIQVNR